MTSPTEISTKNLYRQLGAPENNLIVDLRLDNDFADDPRIIPSSIRWNYKDMDGLITQFKSIKFTLSCHKGLKISQGAAAILRSKGFFAQTLEGGYQAWVDAKLPVVNYEKIPKKNIQQQSLWVTRHRPKIDRIACPWLIRRFVDPNAQFLYVSPSQVLNVAEHFDATPFDVEDVFWSHRENKCTFDTMIKEFGLETEPLKEMAKIIRAADTNDHKLAEQACGLLALSVGFSRMIKDDLAQLDAMIPIYDALYRWARDAMNEGHDWPVQH